PAADVIAQAAERHRAQRAERHLTRVGLARAGMLAEQEQQLARPRKLRRVAEAAGARIERLAKLRDRFRQRLRPRYSARPAGALQVLQLQREGVGGLDDFGALAVPDARDLLQDVHEPRPSPSRRRRKVGAAVK